jgi:cytochrome c biogenesis protein CcmG, thiol:disulfide interchange protein DsbE
LAGVEPVRDAPKGRIFWLLVALTIITIGIGLWRWQAARQETAARITKQSVPSLTGTSQSRAPEFSLQGLDGEAVSLQSLRGKVVLVNFWATWCPPCKAEMPDLDALQREYGEDKDFVVLGVNVEEDAEAVKSFAEQHRLSFPIVLDRDGSVTTKQFGVRPLPTTFIIDREGFIRDAWNGQIAPEAMLARLQRVW